MRAPANASGVDGVLVSYRVDGGEWWNTNMTYTSTSGLWITVIPGQLGNTTVEFFVKAYDEAGNMNASSTYSHLVTVLPVGDINGDGNFNIWDLAILSDYWLQEA